MIQIKSKSVSVFIYITILFLCIITGLIFSGHIAGAISNFGPDPAEFGINGANGRYILNNYTALDGSGPHDQSDITIPIYSINRTIANCSSTTMDLDVYNIERFGSPQDQWIEYNNVSSDRFHTAKTINVTDWNWDLGTEMCRSLVKFKLRNGDNGNPPNNYYNNAIEFRLKTNTSWLIGNGWEGSPRFNIRAANSNAGQNKFYNYAIELATPCSIKNDQKGIIHLLDLDSGIGDNENGPVTYMIDDTTLGYSGTAVYHDSGLADMGQNGDFEITLTYKPSHKYKLHLNGISPINVVRYILPYDNPSFNIECDTLTDWTIEPSVSVVSITDASGNLTPDQTRAYLNETITWNHNVKNIGNDPTTTNVEYKYMNGISPDIPAPSGYLPPYPIGNLAKGSGAGLSDGGGQPSSYTVTQADVDTLPGVNVCRATWARPKDSAHSNPGTKPGDEIVSGYACIPVGNPIIIKQKVWSITPTAVVSSITDSGGNSTGSLSIAKPGDTIQWTHSVTNNGPDELNADVFAFDQQLDAVNNVYNNLGGYTFLVNGSLAGATNNFTSNPLYSVSQSDVGKNICRRTYAFPRASYDLSSPIASFPDACVYVPYDYVLTPFVTLNPNGSIEAGSDLIASLFVNNSGPTISKPTNWKLSRTIGGSAAVVVMDDGGSKIVFQPSMTTNLPDFPDLAPDIPAGTHICYVLSVQPHASWDDNWFDSDPACIVISKKPKVQIWGGDLLTRGTRSGPDYSVTTSTSDRSGTRYGSWAEYGILAKGNILGAASGAAYAPGGLTYNPLVDNACLYSKLSFTNAGSSTCTGTGIGNYSNASSMPDVAASFQNISATPLNANLDANTSGVYTTTASSFTITGSNIGQGKWVVINAPNADIIIADDIKYLNGSFNSINDIPQVIIIANSITINHEVANVDAWLIANKNDSSYIATCDEGGKTINECNQKLTVNGPVMTNHLYLRRTFGSDPSTPGEPAEVFNLRADAYLWSMSRASNSGRIQTVYTTELPPRL